MARRRRVVESAPAVGVPEELQVCWVEDWLSAGVLWRPAWGRDVRVVSDVRLDVVLSAWRRWQRARREWYLALSAREGISREEARHRLEAVAPDRGPRWRGGPEVVAAVVADMFRRVDRAGWVWPPTREEVASVIASEGSG